MSSASLNRCRGAINFRARRTIFSSQTCHEIELKNEIPRFMGVCRCATLRQFHMAGKWPSYSSMIYLSKPPLSSGISKPQPCPDPSTIECTAYQHTWGSAGSRKHNDAGFLWSLVSRSVQRLHPFTSNDGHRRLI